MLRLLKGMMLSATLLLFREAQVVSTRRKERIDRNIFTNFQKFLFLLNIMVFHFFPEIFSAYSKEF